MNKPAAYPGHTCNWDSWFGGRTIWDQGGGHRACDLDHGLRGKIEVAIMTSVGASAGGPILGVHAAITEILKLIEEPE